MKLGKDIRKLPVTQRYEIVNNRRRLVKTIGKGVVAAGLAVGSVIGLAATGGDQVPGQKTLLAIETGKIPVDASPHLLVLKSGVKIRSTPVEPGSSEPDNLLLTVPDGQVALIDGAGQLEEDGTVWGVANKDGDLVFVDETDILEQQAESGETLITEYAPKTLDFSEPAIAKDGQLREPNNALLGKVSLMPADELGAFISRHDLKPVDLG